MGMTALRRAFHALQRLEFHIPFYRMAMVKGFILDVLTHVSLVIVALFTCLLLFGTRTLQKRINMDKNNEKEKPFRY